jgi:hypothetical protein
VSRFIDEHRGRFGVEPICRVLGVSASAYYERASGRRSRRAVEDERLLEGIERVQAANFHCYGYRRTWLALRRDGVCVGRDRVKRLMRAHGLQGAKRRGKPWRTTIPDPAAVRPPDRVNRDFTAAGPDRLWVADFCYLRCWDGLVFFAFVIDVYSRRIVGWQLAGHMRTDLVLASIHRSSPGFVGVCVEGVGCGRLKASWDLFGGGWCGVGSPGGAWPFVRAVPGRRSWRWWRGCSGRSLDQVRRWRRALGCE